MLSSDKLAIYSDAPKQIGNIVRPYAFGVDAIERMRVVAQEAGSDARQRLLTPEQVGELEGAWHDIAGAPRRRP